MSYKNDDTLVILNKYGKAGSIAKTELYETYDRLRDLTVSGPTLGGSGFGAFGGFLTNVARTIGSTAFSPTLGSSAIGIPGTSFYTPISGGSGIIPGGQAAFGLAPYSQYTGLPTGGAAGLGSGFSLPDFGSIFGGAAPVEADSDWSAWSDAFSTNSTLGPLSVFAQNGIGALNVLGQNASAFNGIGDTAWQGGLGQIDSGAFGPSAGTILGGASPIVDTAVNAAGLAAGGSAGGGFGRNIVLPLAGAVSGIGGLLTTLGPFFGPYGIAGAAAGSILSGLSGAVLNSYQSVSSRILANADVELSNKVKNLETTIKMLDAQQDILKKLLKDTLDSDKKALDNI